MQKFGATFQIDGLIEAVINSGQSAASLPADMRARAERARAFDCSAARAVVFGGGTGLSTVIGGNSQLASWPENFDVGLKMIFPHLDTVVCTTDDGGSTGSFLKHFPMIGIGDMRKACLSMIRSCNLEKTYGISSEQCSRIVCLVHRIFNYRFPLGYGGFKYLAEPLLVAPGELRNTCPAPLKQTLCLLGKFFTPAGQGPAIKPGGHSLGNMLLAAAILMETGGNFERPARMQEVRRGLDLIARALGITPGCVHPATVAPGELVFRYANGVEVQGESKSTTARRGFPVEAVYTEFRSAPVLSSRIIRAVQNADLIVLAPGSLYTSIIPALQLPGLADLIRANRRALKILGANFWIEEGETDITHADKRRGYRISELIEAYNRNVPGGAAGLFDFVLSANLEHVPGSIIRNYALEGKRPIYLDREHVEAMGVQPVESTLFSLEQLRQGDAIQHNPEKFALALRTMLYSWQQTGLPKEQKSARPGTQDAPRGCRVSKPFLCDYRSAVDRMLASKLLQPRRLRGIMSDLLWDNRDIRPDHLDRFKGVRVIPAAAWNRSTEWDNVLGYYDPEDRLLKIHSHLSGDPVELRGNLLIALGESLLGRYIESRRWIAQQIDGPWGCRSYEIRLRPPRDRDCLLSPAQLHAYLQLARMVPDPEHEAIYRITLNNNDGFIPPGLLFGLMYAWYLDNSCAPVMENEMSMLHWHEATLIPHQVQEYRRKKALIDFFRTEIFGYTARRSF
jgi:uncharacterized cofD-like protein